MTISRHSTAPHNRRRMALASLLLAGSLVLGGCTVGAEEGLSTTSGQTTMSETNTTISNTELAEATDSTSTADTITGAADAAERLLATLSDEQRTQLVYGYDDETKSTSWSNFPVTFVDRAGLNLSDLSDEQRTAAMEVLDALLSDEGYSTIADIMGGDVFLHENSTSTEDSLGQYYLAFFGDPSGSSPWEIQFGGHHIGINATLDGSAQSITFAPTHLGSQPAVYTDSEGNEMQPLAAMYATAFAFYDSLSPEQQAQLYQGTDVQNLVCAPGSTCDYPTGTGIAGSELTDEQKQPLLDVIANWVSLADEQTTSEALATIEATLDQTYVNWSGATEYDMSQGDGVYFRISGPDVYIEFSNQQGSAGADIDGYLTSGWGHVHTIYRDPANDYAGSVTQQQSAGMGGGPGGVGASSGPSGVDLPSGLPDPPSGNVR